MTEERDDFAAKLLQIEEQANMALVDLPAGLTRDRVQHIAIVARMLRYRLDVSTLHRDESVSQLALNEIGRVTLRATSPLFADDYRHNRVTGSFVLIDEATNQTAAAGMLRTSA